MIYIDFLLEKIIFVFFFWYLIEATTFILYEESGFSPHFRDSRGKMLGKFWSVLAMCRVVEDEWRWTGKFQAVGRCILACISINGTAFADMVPNVLNCMDTWPIRLLRFDSLSFRLFDSNKKHFNFSFSFSKRTNNYFSSNIVIFTSFPLPNLSFRNQFCFRQIILLNFV